MKCSVCEFKSFFDGNGSPNRYYCNHPDAPSGASSLICKTERGSIELTRKTSPKWCPLSAINFK